MASTGFNRHTVPSARPHDERELATVRFLRVDLSAEVVTGDADVTVDLSDGTYAGQPMIGVLVGAKRTRREGRWLTLRASPQCARWMLDVFVVGDLLTAPSGASSSH